MTYEPRMDPHQRAFEEAMSELRKGKIPTTMPFVAAYIRNTTRELTEYSQAMTECAYRLNNSNKVLREMATALQAAFSRKAEAELAGNDLLIEFSGVIPWLDAKIRTELDKGAIRDSDMYATCMKAVLCVMEAERRKNA